MPQKKQLRRGKIWARIYRIGNEGVIVPPKCGATSFDRCFTKGPLLVNCGFFNEIVNIKGVTRNPWARLVSCYRDKRAVLSNYGVDGNMSFSDFVHRISEWPYDQADRHFRPQVDLMSLEDRFLPDQNIDISMISRIWGVDRENCSGRYNYRDYYNEKLKLKVESYYTKDIEQFGYIF